MFNKMHSYLYSVGSEKQGRLITAEKLATLKRGFNTEENEALFAAARHRHPALVEHESIDSVLAVLAVRSKNWNTEKDELTRVLVAETQNTRHPFWFATLILAYIPMLCRLSGRIRRNATDADERLQLVVTAFLEAVISISIQRSWFCLSLRRETERRVFRHLSGERRQRRVIGSIESLEPQQHEAALKSLFDSGSPWPATRSERARDGLEPDEKNACVAYLREHAEHVLDDEEMALVAATLVHGHRLTDYVREHHPDLDDISRQRLYQRLKRRHSRAMAKLRELLAERWEELNALKAEIAAWPWPRSVAALR